MLSASQVRKMQKTLSPHCVAFVIKAMNGWRLSSSQYNALVTEISELSLRAGMSTQTAAQLALFGTSAPLVSQALWEELKLALEAVVTVESPIVGPDPAEVAERLSHHTSILMNSILALNPGSGYEPFIIWLATVQP